MGKYDDINPDQLRADLVRFAQLIMRLDQHEALLRSAAEVQRLLGDLRRKLFAYEVRSTAHLGTSGEAHDTGSPGPLVEDSLRIVREALKRQEEALDDWHHPFPGDDEGDQG